jgi:translation initiation factor 6 (eIF-6)
MPFSHPKINQLVGGWYIVYKDSSVTTMDEVGCWRNVKNKNEIRIVGLKCKHKHYELMDKDLYVPPGETQVRELSIGGSEVDGVMVTTLPVAGWFIGYYDNEKEAKILIRCDRVTGKFFIEEIPYKQERV